MEERGGGVEGVEGVEEEEAGAGVAEWGLSGRRGGQHGAADCERRWGFREAEGEGEEVDEVEGAAVGGVCGLVLERSAEKRWGGGFNLYFVAGSGGGGLDWEIGGVGGGQVR